jgi:hypothetical protein
MENWHRVTSFDLIRIGTANRKNLIESALSKNQHLIIQFLKRSHLSMIPALKTIIDNYLGLNQTDFEFKNASKKQNMFSNPSRIKPDFSEFQADEYVKDENFNPGVLFLIHLNESSTQDLKNTGLSFWDCWDNWVIEDIVDSGYNSIGKYFFQTSENKAGHTVLGDDLESVWHLLNNNEDLRSRVFEKLTLDVLSRINDEVPQFHLESEMS